MSKTDLITLSSTVKPEFASWELTIPGVGHGKFRERDLPISVGEKAEFVLRDGVFERVRDV